MSLLCYIDGTFVEGLSSGAASALRETAMVRGGAGGPWAGSREIQVQVLALLLLLPGKLLPLSGLQVPHLHVRT